jgi:hypothetical protein
MLPGRVAGNGHGHGAVTEPEFVAVRELAINPRRHCWFGRELAHHLVVEGPFPVGQVRWRPDRLAVDERRVGVVGEDFYLAPAGDVGRGANVIGVEVRQDQPPQVRRTVPGLVDRCRDQGRGAGEAGVDERESVGIAPKVGLPDRKADEVQARHQLDDVHTPTVSSCRPGTPGHLLSADGLLVPAQLTRGLLRPPHVQRLTRCAARPACRYCQGGLRNHHPGGAAVGRAG